MVVVLGSAIARIARSGSAAVAIAAMLVVGAGIRLWVMAVRHEFLFSLEDGVKEGRRVYLKVFQNVRWICSKDT